MRIQTIGFIALSLAGLLSCSSEQPAETTIPPGTDPSSPSVSGNVFSRMFPELPPFTSPTDEAREQMNQLGARGGLLDARDGQTNGINPDNPNMTAGVTFFGQFVAHDLARTEEEPLLQQAEPRRTTNLRTAKLDLDNLYGEGPDRSPELYETASGDIKFRVEVIPGSEQVSRKGAVRFDLPRGPNQRAIIADSRNDENLLLSQFHLAMLMFHNAVVDRLRSDPAQATRSRRERFNEARRQVTWHYQWIILHKFLPLTIGQDRVDDLVQNGPRFYRLDDRAQDALFRNSQGDPLIPIEFAVAAFRFGHSQVRPSYRANFGPDGGPSVALSIFNPSVDPNDPDPNDLRGGKRAPRRFVDWQTFFRIDNTNPLRNKRIDTKLSSRLMELPGPPVPDMPSDGILSLASRNLIRQVNFGIPSGQAIAGAMGVPVLTAEQLAELTPFGLDRSTPLWYYILKEAEVLENGLRLGPVGSRIVGDVFIGLLTVNKDTCPVIDKNCKPTLPSANPGDFEITDLLNFAGVVPPLN
jgi:hypothetical protein